MTQYNRLPRLLLPMLCAALFLALLSLLLPQRGRGAAGGLNIQIVFYQDSDLQISQTVVSQPAIAGEWLTYVITLKNNGALSFTQVIITDTFPVSTTFQNSYVNFGSCGQISNGITCTIGALEPGISALVTIELQTDAAILSGTLLTNTVFAWAAEFSSTIPNSHTQTILASAYADLIVSKSDLPDPAFVGEGLVYQLDVQNTGPSTAQDLLLVDVLPPAVSFNSATEGCQFLSGEVHCAFSLLEPGEHTTASIQVDVLQAGVATNWASVVSSVVDPITSNNVDLEDTSIFDPAHLHLQASSLPPSATAGEALTYSISLSNQGPLSFTAVTITDTLPSSLTVTTIQPAGLCEQNDIVIQCPLGTLAPSDAVSITIETLVDEALTTTLLNLITATSAELGPGRAAAEQVQTPVGADVDLQVSITDLPDPILVGGNLLYQIAVTNRGSSQAHNVVLTDTLPSGVEIFFLDSGCSEINPGVIRCSLKNLSKDASQIISIGVKPLGSGLILNQVVVSRPQTPVPGSDQEPTTVFAVNDLQISKVGEPEDVAAGEVVTYRIGVTNTGWLTFTQVVLTDTLPAGVNLNALIPGCTSQDRNLVCPIGDLPRGVGADFAFSVTVDAAFTDTLLINSLNVGADQFPLSTTYLVTETTAIFSRSDLYVEKEALSEFAFIGEPFTYTIRLGNDGPSMARQVILTETLPLSAALKSISGAVCGEVVNGQMICPLDAVHPQDDPLLLTLVITPLLSGSMVNHVAVGSSVSDPNSENNQDDVITQVYARSDLTITQKTLPDFAIAGTDLTYVLTVTNMGSLTYTGVLLDDMLPLSTTLTSSIHSSQGGCIPVEQGFTCDLQTLLPLASAQITVILRTDAAILSGTLLVNIVEVSSVDFPEEKNLNIDRVRVFEQVDLSIDKSGPEKVLKESISAQMPIEYVLTFGNAGPSVARGVSIVDDLPAQVKYVSINYPVDVITYSNIGQTVIFTVTRALKIDEKVSVTILTQVKDDTKPGTIRNQARITSPARSVWEYSVWVPTILWSDKLYLPLTVRNYSVVPPQPPERILFGDDFCTDKGWESTAGLASKHWVDTTACEYVLAGAVERQIERSAAPDLVVGSPYTVEVKARISEASESEARYALTFNWQNQNNFYVFLVNPWKQTYAVWKYTGKWVALVQETTRADIIKLDRDQNTLQVVRHGDSIKVYANGQYLTEVFDGSLVGGRVGVELWPGNDTAAQVRFDKFKVTVPPNSGDDFCTDKGWESTAGLASKHWVDTTACEYVLAGAVERQIERSAAPDLVVGSPYTVEVKARISEASESEARYALTFNWQNQNNFYVFLVNPWKQTYAVWKYTGKWVALVQETTRADIIKLDRDQNTLQVVRHGDSIKVYANGQYLTEVFDGSLVGGRVGVELWPGNDTAAQARFDDFVVK